MGNEVMRQIKQLRPATPTFEQLRKQNNFWYENVDKEQEELLDKKIHLMAQKKKEFARSITNPISREELKKLAGKNSASYMLGFDLNSELITDLLKKEKICPAIGESWDEDKTKCVHDKNVKKAMRKLLKKATILGGEVMYKSDLPKCYDTIFGECQVRKGTCVPKADCNPQFENCENICGSNDCICKIQQGPQCSVDNKECGESEGECVPRESCRIGQGCENSVVEMAVSARERYKFARILINM